MEYVCFLINQKQKVLHTEHGNGKNFITKSKFEDLSDEIILKIFNHVNIKDLFRCMAVCKRMRAIANDKTLWERMHLTGRFQDELLKHILKKGCQYLSLDSCKILKSIGNVRIEENEQLKYLSLHNCYDDPFDYFHCLAFIGNSCSNLENVLMSHCSTSLKFQYQCVNMHHGTLNVSCLREYRFRHIISYYPGLVELNISCLPEEIFPEKCIEYICNNLNYLTWKIEKIDVSGQKHFGDEQLKELLYRCNKLTEFAFGNTSVSDKSVYTIRRRLSETLVKIDCGSNISEGELPKLLSMPKLKVLNEKLHIATPYLLDKKQEKYQTSYRYWDMNII